MKPSDFFVGVHDFFAVLLPGAAATYLIYEEIDAREFEPVHALGEPWSFVAVAFASYLLGHLIFLAGSALDPLYDRRRRRTKTAEDELTFSAADKFRREKTKELKDSSFSTFKWCRSYISLRSDIARRELEYFEATSKFFRSLVVLFGLVAAGALVTAVKLPASRLVVCAAAAGLAWMCFLRFCDQRWKLNELAYAYVFLVPSDGKAKGEQAKEDE